MVAGWQPGDIGAAGSLRLRIWRRAKKKEEGKADEEQKEKTRTRPWVIDRLHFKEDEIGYLDRLRTHLYVFNLADGKMKQVTFGDYDDSDPAWSPDGKSIAFTSNRTAEPDSNFNSDIWVVDVDSGDPAKSLVQVTTSPAEDLAPAWSPDGKTIAFVTQIDPKLFWYATYHLAVVPASGGEPRILTKSLDREVSAPRFSPTAGGFTLLRKMKGHRISCVWRRAAEK